MEAPGDDELYAAAMQRQRRFAAPAAAAAAWGAVAADDTPLSPGEHRHRHYHSAWPPAPHGRREDEDMGPRYALQPWQAPPEGTDDDGARRAGAGAAADAPRDAAAALAGEVRALVVEAARAWRSPGPGEAAALALEWRPGGGDGSADGGGGGGDDNGGGDGNGGDGPPTLTAGQRLRLVVHAAMRESALTVRCVRGRGGMLCLWHAVQTSRTPSTQRSLQNLFPNHPNMPHHHQQPVLAALDGAVALHPTAAPALLRALHDRERAALPGAVAAAAAAGAHPLAHLGLGPGAGGATPAVAPPTTMTTTTTPAAAPSAPRRASALSRVSGPWDGAPPQPQECDGDGWTTQQWADERQQQQQQQQWQGRNDPGGDATAPAPMPAAPALASRRDPRAARLGRLSSASNTPSPRGLGAAAAAAAAWAEQDGGGQQQQQQQQQQRQLPQQQQPDHGAPEAAGGGYGGGGVNADGGEDLSQLTAADVLLLATLRGGSLLLDNLVAAALCAAAQASSHAALAAAVRGLAGVSDDALAWLLGVALAWLGAADGSSGGGNGCAAATSPALAPAGRRIFAAALEASPATCRLALARLLERVAGEACAAVGSGLWGALDGAAAAAAAALATEPLPFDGGLDGSGCGAVEPLPPEVAVVAAGELLGFFEARALALPRAVAARLVAAVAPLAGAMPSLAAALARISLDAAADARAAVAASTIKPEAGLEAVAEPFEGSGGSSGGAGGGGGGDNDDDAADGGSGGDDAASDGDPLGCQLRNARRRLAEAARRSWAASTASATARASPEARLRLTGDEALAAACAEALLRHASPQQHPPQWQDGGAAAGEEDDAGDSWLAPVMREWLGGARLPLQLRLLAARPGPALAAEWQSALLGELSRLVEPAPSPAAGAHFWQQQQQEPQWLHRPRLPTWLECRHDDEDAWGDDAAGGCFGNDRPALALPPAPAVLDAVMRSLAPAAADWSMARGQCDDGEPPCDAELRVPADPDALARCGLQLCAVLLQAVHGGGDGADGGAELADGGNNSREAAAERAARLLARAQALAVLQRALLACPALGVLLALMHRAGGAVCACSTAAGVSALPGGGVCGGTSGVCSALAAVEGGAAESDAAWWEPRRAEALLSPLQLVMCREQARVEALAAAALERLMAPGRGRGGGAGGDAAAAAAGADDGNAQQQQQQQVGQDSNDGPRQGKKQKRAPDVSAFVVVWGGAGGGGGGGAQGIGGAPAAGVDEGAAALRSLPPWLLRRTPPPPVQAAHRLLTLAAQQMADAAAASSAAAPAVAAAAASQPLSRAPARAAAQTAWAALRVAGRCVAAVGGALRPAEAGALAAAAYALHRATVRLLAERSAAPPLDAAGGPAAAAAATPGGRAARRRPGAQGALSPGGLAVTASSSAAGAAGSSAAAAAAAVDEATVDLLQLAGASLELAARAVNACAALTARQQQQQQATGGVGSGAGELTGHLSALADAVSPEAGRFEAAQAALKTLRGGGVSLGPQSFNAARRGASQQPLLAARVALAMRALALARWHAARSAPVGGGAGGNAPAADADADEPTAPAAPLLQGLLALQRALAAAWAAERAALFARAAGAEGAGGAGAVVGSEADAARCEELLGDLGDELALGE